MKINIAKQSQHAIEQKQQQI